MTIFDSPVAVARQTLRRIGLEPDEHAAPSAAAPTVLLSGRPGHLPERLAAYPRSQAARPPGPTAYTFVMSVMPPDPFEPEPQPLRSTGTATIEREEVREGLQEPGDHERFSHYVRKEKILESALSGEPVVALCGKVWVPGRDPQKFPVCPVCKEIHDGLRDPQDGGDGGSGGDSGGTS